MKWINKKEPIPPPFNLLSIPLKFLLATVSEFLLTVSVFRVVPVWNVVVRYSPWGHLDQRNFHVILRRDNVWLSSKSRNFFPEISGVFFMEEPFHPRDENGRSSPDWTQISGHPRCKNLWYFSLSTTHCFNLFYCAGSVRAILIAIVTSLVRFTGSYTEDEPRFHGVQPNDCWPMFTFCSAKSARPVALAVR